MRASLQFVIGLSSGANWETENPDALRHSLFSLVDLFMRRKSTVRKLASGPYDIVKDVGAEKLQTFAAIILTWNYIEAFVDGALGFALRIDADMFVDVSSRINGLDGKIAIIKKCIIVLSAGEQVRLPISKSLNAVESYKKYRDAVAHIRIVNPQAEIADTAPKRGSVDEVLVSLPALESLHAHLGFLGNEISCVYQLLAYAAIGDISEDPLKKKQAEELARRALMLLNEAQRQREALPQFPKFPDE